VAVIGPLYLAVVMGILIARITATETSAEVEESLDVAIDEKIFK
jgi:hypothetical protein